jgi:alpha-1,2-mannosyltransferase
MWSGLAVVVVALLLDLLHGYRQIGIDFHTYLAGAAVGQQQGWSHLYDQALVAAEQKRLVASQLSQPFLSPPTVAWLVSPLTLFPYGTALAIWAVVTFLGFALALVWSGVSGGMSRWVLAAAALAPWWVAHAVSLGQVVPLVAAGVVVSWRLLREEKEIAAGLVLAVIFLKPNTAILVPFALLAVGRYRAFAAWLGAGAVLAVLAVLVLGLYGVSGYVDQLSDPLPGGAESLTLKGALGASGVLAVVLRLVIVALVLATAYRLRGAPSLALPLGIVGSLVVAPYLHASDLCLLAAAAYIIWEERTAVAWRAAIVAGWVLASPFLFGRGLSPGLTRWPLIELIVLVALVVAAWRPLTTAADLRTRAPA